MATVDGKRAAIALITCDEVNRTIGVDVCECKGMWITPEHPILWSRDIPTSLSPACQPIWVMPKDVLEVRREYSIDALYNFELSPGASSVIINGIGVMSLGQEIGFEPISDALYGWGWNSNPERQRYLTRMNAAQEALCVFHSNAELVIV